MAAEKSPAEKLQGAARKNYERLSQKLGLRGAAAPAGGPSPPPAAAPPILSPAQALSMAGKLMEMGFDEFDAEARRLLNTGQRAVLRALATSRPEFQQDIDVIRRWARSAYAGYLLKEMRDDGRWQVARILNDRLLLWVETRSPGVADELRTIRREIGF